MLMLTAENVYNISKDCMWTEEEVTANGDREKIVSVSKVVDALTVTFCFHPQRLESHRQEIGELLSQLPKEFEEGYSFLAACCRADGELWGQHTDMEALFAIGIGIGRARCLLPQELWSSLPGGMPYFQTKNHDGPWEGETLG